MHRIVNTLSILLLLLGLAIPALANNSGVLAIVDGHAVTDLDLQKRLEFIMRSSNISHNPATINLMRQQVLQLLIDERLIAQEAQKFSLKVEPQELKKIMASIAQRAGVKPEQFKDFIKAQGLDYQQLESSLRNQALREKVVKFRIWPLVHVLDSEVAEMEKIVKTKQQRPTTSKQVTDVKLAEISIFLQGAEKAQIEKLLKQLVKELHAGAKFDKLAKDFSQSGSAANGGEIGWINVAQLDDNIVEMLKRLKVGDVSPPIMMSDRIQLFKLLDQRSKNVVNQPAPPPTKEQLYEFIWNKKLDAKIKAYMQKLRKTSGVVINKE